MPSLLNAQHLSVYAVSCTVQFVCAGNPGISCILCNANTFWSIHEGLFFNSGPALDFKISLETPLYPFLFLFASFTT
jgi:hypothetical protein